MFYVFGMAFELYQPYRHSNVRQTLSQGKLKNNIMTNSISAIKRKDQECSYGMINNIFLLHKLTKRSIDKMELRQKQLNIISKGHFDSLIRLEAEHHFEKQSKLLFIGYELLNRMKTTLDRFKTSKILNEDLVKQYAQELDLLNHMDFEVTRKHFSFIQTNYESRLLITNQRAA